MPETICGPCKTCTDCIPNEKEEHRGSRWTGLLREAASDPIFLNAINEFTVEEREMLERVGGR